MERPEDDAAWRVHVTSSIDEGDGRGVHALSKTLGVSMKTARRTLDRAPFQVPLNLKRSEALELARELSDAGLDAESRMANHATAQRCRAHPTLANDGQCERCQSWICIACNADADGDALCPSCFQKHTVSELFRNVRVAILLMILVGVASWAWAEQSRLKERNHWERTLRVGVVVLELEPVDDSAIGFLRARLENLAEVLDDEFARHNDRRMRPFEFILVGHTPIAALPPEQPGAEAGFVDNVELKFALDEYLEGPAERLGLEEDAYDTVMWVVVKDGARASGGRFVEGLAEVGGDRGLVVVDLDESTAALAAGVIGHELFHTLGATDKYDASGPIFPDGYFEPRVRYPQKRAEIMGREIPLTADQRRLPNFVAEIGVGKKTAREIGWGENMAR